MKSRKLFVLAIGLLASLDSAAQRLRANLTEVTLNYALPEEFRNRLFWKEGIFKFSIDQLAGSLIYAEDTLGNYVRGPRLLQPNTQLSVKPVEKGEIYHSKVDRGFDAKINWLIFDAGMSQGSIVDVKITDLMWVLVNANEVPLDSLLKIADAQNSIQRKYYIQGVLLTSITKQYSSRVNGRAAIAGTAFGANGEIYKTDETSVQDFCLSLTLIDLDKLKFFSSGKHLSNTSSNEVSRILAASTVKKYERVRIKGLK